MTELRELVAIVVVACLIPVGFPQQAQAMAAAQRGGEFRQKLEQLGIGAEVRVTLRDQHQALRGTVESFDDSAVRLRPRGNGEQQTVRYADALLLEFPQTKYRAEGSSDPVMVRRVAVELGIGRKVQVRTRDSNTLVGRIAKLDAEQLNLDLGGAGPMNVSYAQISELKPKGMSTKAKVGYVALACGVFVLIGIISLAVNPPG